MTHTIQDADGREHDLADAENLDRFFLSAPEDRIRRSILRLDDKTWKIYREPAEPYDALPLGRVSRTAAGVFQAHPYGQSDGRLPAPRESLISAALTLT